MIIISANISSIKLTYGAAILDIFVDGTWDRNYKTFRKCKMQPLNIVHAFIYVYILLQNLFKLFFSNMMIINIL